MAESSKENEIRVLLLPVGRPTPGGHTYSYEELQRAIDARLLRRVSDKMFYGEYDQPKGAEGVARTGTVMAERVCLRLTSINLMRHGLLGAVVPAGPRKDEFLAIVQDYKQPIPLAMRAYINRDGSIAEIISFDFVSSLLQNVPKIAPAMTTDEVYDRAMEISDAAQAAAQARTGGGTMEQNTILNPQPAVAFGQKTELAPDSVLAKVARKRAAKKVYVKPEVKTIAQAEYDAALQKPARKKAAKKSARGMTSTVLHLDEAPFVPMTDNQITDEYNRKTFAIYEAALRDPEVAEMLGDKIGARIIGPETSEPSPLLGSAITEQYEVEISFTAGDVTRTLHKARDGSLTSHVVRMHAIHRSDEPQHVQTTLIALNHHIENCVQQFLSDIKDTEMPTPATDKKLPAKAVFKAIDPIVSKNVEAHYDEAFRIRPGTKFDGYLKKLAGKSGAFVRIKGDEDIYALPYTIKSEKKAAGERSLRDALATRGITIVDTDDLKGI